MTDEQVKMLADAIRELAGAIADLGQRHTAAFAADEPFNYTVGRGLKDIAEAIEHHA